jgi:hypothetical protein
MGLERYKKRGAWVVRDEILHCVQNDKVHVWVLRKLPSRAGG